MRTYSLTWNEAAGWRGDADGPVDLVIYFGSRAALAEGERFAELRARFPAAHLVGCSTGGQIRNDDVTDDDITAVAMKFQSTGLRLACERIDEPAQSRACGAALGRALASPDLAGVFLLSDGLNVNGSELVAGLALSIGDDIPLTGGLAGDGDRFQETLVGGDCPPCSHLVTAVGFYGASVRIGHGSAGGWDQFGPRRRITRSHGNVLFELDGQPALDLYERYLGDDAEGLPGTGLLFPLRIYDPERPDYDLVRTILAIDRDKRSMTFAGDVPEGWVAQLMRGDFDRLAEGAAEAARQANRFGSAEPGVALLVSCIGRRLLMGQRILGEIEAAAGALAPQLRRLGFYSYGEISPHPASRRCQLHNQTMTVTVIQELPGRAA